jgi:hypothetical protein
MGLAMGLCLVRGSGLGLCPVMGLAMGLCLVMGSGSVKDLAPLQR